MSEFVRRRIHTNLCDIGNQLQKRDLVNESREHPKYRYCYKTWDELRIITDMTFDITAAMRTTSYQTTLSNITANVKNSD